MGSSPQKRYEKIVEMLALVVKDRVFGPVDRMARAIDTDSVKLALYEAMRYVSSGPEGLKRELPKPEEIEEFINDLRIKGPGLARDVALKAYAKGHLMRLEEEEKANKSKTTSQQQQA